VVIVSDKKIKKKRKKQRQKMRKECQKMRKECRKMKYNFMELEEFVNIVKK
jgi:DNA-binding protein YbaB